ncbi:MAG: 30S ribosomal protein S7 [Planctomycetota bacterium]|nr:30S ribosomal protein S7 [Planctomycetota bacterium]
MAGRITKSEQQLRPDPRYGDKILSKFINCIMLDGKKNAARKVMYSAMDLIDERLKKEGGSEGAPKNALELFHRAIDNVKPDVEVRSKRVGGANYQVPMPVTAKRRQSLGFRWLIVAVRGESGKPMHIRLAKELWDAAQGDGKAMNVRDQTHRMADANKAFAHFAW